MASHGSTDSPGSGGGWRLSHSAAWVSRPPQAGDLTGLAACSGERSKQGECLPPSTFPAPALATLLAFHWPHQVSRPSLRPRVREACLPLWEELQVTWQRMGKWGRGDEECEKNLPLFWNVPLKAGELLLLASPLALEGSFLCFHSEVLWLIPVSKSCDS